MPKYSVEDVLNIIRTFTPQERRLLQEQLVSISESLETPLSNQATTVGSQVQTMRDLAAFGGSSISVNQGRNITSNQSRNQVQATDVSVKEALSLFQALKRSIAVSSDLTVLDKKTLEAQITVAEEELKKPEPDKNLIDQVIEALQKGLKGVLTLAEPVTKIAEILAKTWFT